MRLLHVIHSLDPATGGPAEAVRNLVACPGGAAHEIATLDSVSDAWNGEYRAEIHALGSGAGVYGYAPRLKHFLRSRARQYDALIIHGLWQYHGHAASRAAMAGNVPYFIFPHGMLDPYFSRVSILKRIKKRLYWPVERSNLNSSRAVFFTCEEEKTRALSEWRWKSESRIVPLGIQAPAPVGPEPFLKSFPDLRGKRLLLFLGRLHPKKGVDLLLRAFRKVAPDFPDTRLALAGPPCSARFERDLRLLAAGLPVTFCGMLRGELKFAAIHAADAFVLPSHQENFGLAVLEALACGIPALISDQVNIWREILEDAAGLAAPDHEAGITRLLRDWLSLPPERAREMRAAARRCYERRFRAEIASEQLIATIRGCGIALDERENTRMHPASA